MNFLIVFFEFLSNIEVKYSINTTYNSKSRVHRALEQMNDHIRLTDMTDELYEKLSIINFHNDLHFFF